MNEETMRKHYERTPKDNLISILISSRKEFDKLQNRNKEYKQEIERLNNIINKLENWLNEKICLNKNDKDYVNGMTFVGVNLRMYQMFLDKLQELKGSDKE